MPVLDTPITADSAGIKKILGQKQPAIIVVLDGAGKDKPLEDALKREAKKYAGELLVVKVDGRENPDVAAQYNLSQLPALITLTKAFFGRNIKSSAQGVRPSDVRAHIAHLLNDEPLPEPAKTEPASNGAKAKPVKVTDATFRSEVLKSKKPVLVDFWAVWCGPCQVVAPYVDKVAEKYAGKLKVAKLNVDENQRTSQQFGVQSIPTFIVFENGQIVSRIAGANPTAIQRMIDQVLA